MPLVDIATGAPWLEAKDHDRLLADALEEHLDLPVHVAVPDGERSWSGKAVTRGSAVSVDIVSRGGRRIGRGGSVHG